MCRAIPRRAGNRIQGMRGPAYAGPPEKTVCEEAASPYGHTMMAKHRFLSIKSKPSKASLSWHPGDALAAQQRARAAYDQRRSGRATPKTMSTRAQIGLDRLALLSECGAIPAWRRAAFNKSCKQEMSSSGWYLSRQRA